MYIYICTPIILGLLQLILSTYYLEGLSLGRCIYAAQVYTKICVDKIYIYIYIIDQYMDRLLDSFDGWVDKWIDGDIGRLVDG